MCGPTDVLECRTRLMVTHGVPAHLHADHGPECTARAVRTWLARVGAQTRCMEPGSPWANGYVESVNGKRRDELLAREIFDTRWEAQVLIEDWRTTYNQLRPHSSLGNVRPRLKRSRQQPRGRHAHRRRPPHRRCSYPDSHSPWYKTWGRSARTSNC